MQVEASSTTQSAFWQATCILVVMRYESTCEMETQTTNSDPCMDVSAHRSHPEKTAGPEYLLWLIAQFLV
jgi:hypothetical protein